MWIRYGIAALIMAAAPWSVAQAAEIKVLTAGAMKAVVLALVPDFEAQTGHKVVVANDTAGGLARRITAGETFDVAVITPAVIDGLIGRGQVVARINIAKVGMGVAIRTGAAVPDISSVDAFKRTLVGARSVAYIDPKAGGSSGIYFDGLLDRLGIADQIRPKATLKSGGYVAELLVTGEADLAVHQISEIVPVAGVTLVGPLPAEIQNTTIYAAGVSTAARDAIAAAAFIERLGSHAAAGILKKVGMETP